MKVAWRHGALRSARRIMADQAGMRAINQAVAGFADHPEPPDAFGCSRYRRLRAGSYRVLYLARYARGDAKRLGGTR